MICLGGANISSIMTESRKVRNKGKNMYINKVLRTIHFFKRLDTHEGFGCISQEIIYGAQR